MFNPNKIIMYRSVLLLPVVFLFFGFVYSFAQYSVGGTPPSSINTLSGDYDCLHLYPPDISKVMEDDEVYEKNGQPLRIGVSVIVGYDMTNAGTWTDLPDGGSIWRLKLICKDARAIGVYFDDFFIPEGGKLYLYNKNKKQVIGAYTELNNRRNGIFVTELIQGDEVTLEYYHSSGSEYEPLISISEICYAFRHVSFLFEGVENRDFGDADECLVNINCPEGDTWQDEKNGVARFLGKEGSGYFWCSGSLVNNTAEDFFPYFLTADHCGGTASTSDFGYWSFYFDFESADCDNPGSQPSYNSISGCTKVARGGNGGNTGSDFLLVHLNHYVPEDYTPYFNGWNRNNTASSSGVSIHHPQGDIMKISTYTSSLTSSTWGGTSGTHWRVIWASTDTDHSVTEGGSSGSPIFDPNGRIVGTLTGGSSYCSTPTSPDYYGKFYYHWESNGSTDAYKLKPWLDPDNTGATTVDGVYGQNILPVADFTASATEIEVGESVEFTDISFGWPNNWKWTFEGGSPGSSILQNKTVTYNTAGVYDVTLVAKNLCGNDTLVREDYIHVGQGSINDVAVPDIKIYPNPASDHVNIDLGTGNYTDVTISVYNILGEIVDTEGKLDTSGNIVRIDVSGLPYNIYYIHFNTSEGLFVKKVTIY